MLSNNTPFKLKASKSSRVLHDYQTNQCDESYDEEIGEDDPGPNLNVYNSWDGRYRGLTRPKQTEFRSSRISDRSRVPYRGRGGTSVRRNREYLESGSYYIGGRKYNESLTRNSEASTYRSKFSEPDKSKETKLNFPEDTRISKLLRRLSIEVDQENSLTISKKLLEVLLLPENSTYVRKAFHILGESMYDILQVSPGPLAKEQAARALGRMGYIMGQENDFERYENWMFNKLQNSNDDMRYLFMKSLKETLDFERKNPKLQVHATELMRELVSAIEITDNPEVFKATLDNLMTLVEIYPENFYSQFSNTIDLLFGWHVDPTQPLGNIEFVSRNLQRISKHFQVNLEFSVTLIWHFVEDIETYSNSLLKRDETDELKESSSIEQVTVTILALNTVLKCLGEMFHPANNSQVTLKFVSDCLYQIVKTVSDALQSYVPDNLVIAANDSISILLSIVGTKTSGLNDSIYTLIDIQLSLMNEFLDATIVSMLLTISRVIKELSADLPIELVTKLVGPHSEVIRLRHAPSNSVRDATIMMYQALLNLKNIPLLQEAYHFVLGDLESVYRIILPNVTVMKQDLFTAIESNIEEAELSSLFLFRCLSQLANASGSIIGMWALNPSILELLGVLLHPHDPFLVQNTPSMQYALLHLLQSHCKCYNYFISSSNLVASKQDKKIPMRQLGLSDSLSLVDVATNSPNSGNFAIILQIIYKTLSSKTTLETTLLLLNWFNEILAHSETYLEMLYNGEDFKSVTEVLVKCGYNVNVQIATAVCSILDKLLSNKHLSWSNSFLVTISDLCKMHMNSRNKNVQEIYTNLSVNIPWDVAIVEFNKMYTIEHVKQKYSELNQYNNYTILLAQHLHLTGSFYGEMQPLQFKTFMKYLLENKEVSENWLEDLFVCCCPLESDCQENMDQFRELALTSSTVLNNWATFEAAQFCVNSKLRTPLGKPTETFTTIESTLKQLGRELIKLKNEKTPDNSHPTDQKRVRTLLQFMEHLEKSIYNACQGCAIAMPQLSKPVRTFFNTNASTCHEWLFRIRTVVADLAIHAGEPAVALRHGQAHLKDLVAMSKTQGGEFERTVMQVTLALLILQESEAIRGLYVWSKKVSGRKFAWVKFASEQAGKRYETALNGYKMLLDECEINGEEVEDAEEEDGKIETVGKTKPDVPVQHFIVDQMINCYKELNNWSGLMEFYGCQQSSIKSTGNGVRYSFSSADWESMQWVFNWEVNFTELSNWKPDVQETTWSVFDMQNSIETNLYSVAMNINTVEKDVLVNRIDSTLPMIFATIQDNLTNLPSGYLQNSCLMHYVCVGLKNILCNMMGNTVFLVSENFETEISKIDTRILSKILWWSEFFTRVQNQGTSTFSNNLRLDIIKKARKENNFNLGTVQIFKCLKEKELLYANENGNQQLVITKIANIFLQKVSEVKIWNVDTARIITEIIKFLHSCDASPQLTFNLCAATSTAISKYVELYGGNELRVISSKIILKLATWLQKTDQISLTEINSPLGDLLMVLPEIGITDGSESQIIPTNEMAVGKLLQFGVHQCMGLAKCWNAFGTWCYTWGRKIVDQSSSVNHFLTEDDRGTIAKFLPADVSENDLALVCSILSQTRMMVQDEDIDSNDVNTSEIILSQLQKISSLQNLHESHLQALVQIWKNLQKRVYTYYELSANAYFRYLHLTSNSDSINKTTECNIITVTLRLLRLIVKHALELQTVLEEGLESTPTHPWKVIIPQLFSRLNHPESYVRRRVSELLCRIAKDTPHLITFPAVVGALEGGVKFDFSEITLPKDCLSQSNIPREEDELHDIYEEKYESDNEDKNVLRTCFKSMVETLSQQAPETITQVQLLVKELRRITLLWDELWLGTLAQHHSEIIKRQQQLEQEIDKVNENPNLEKEEKISLIAEKHRIIIKPIIFILEQLNDITSGEPETPHEKQFHERYSKLIKDVLVQLKNPLHPEKPQESWQPLRTLEKTFQQKFHKRASYTLKMVDISPVLANIKNTLIAMPGLATTAKTTVTIISISNHVSILPTKTKPKKLAFYGSDGQTYTYLFKGLEDLHLDERIMQFLSIANTMMAQGADATTHNLYRARYYSVIPLGPRSGLISWVDGTTPVFALYKRWQQREAAKVNGKNSVSANATVPRPSELFYNKLNPLLKEHGVKNIENRKEWPLVVLKKVLTELMNETPSDLLSRELWCYSVNAANYWQVVKRYSYSVAVMSMIGYIIGLGDRHLDNVLIDLVSGEVVHIDYNVCFEKGKTLRVPEKVPFRLTPNLRDALGVTGVEGTFRLACENVLETMKKGRETLLTLLEAFVYDPLIDWTVGNEVLAGTSFGGLGGNTSTKQSRKDLEKEVILSMFHVRTTEIKADWNTNKDEILAEITGVKQSLHVWLEINAKVTETEDYLKDLHQQMALVKEAEAHGLNKHSLYFLPARYEKFRKTKEAINVSKKDLDALIHECESHLERYASAVATLDSQQFSQWFMELSVGVDQDGFRIFELVKEFLQNAGQNTMIEQCELSENEVAQLEQQQNLVTRKCQQLLQEYNVIRVQCPISFIEKYRMFLMLKWCKYLLENKDMNACDLVYQQFCAFTDVMNSPQLKPVVEFSYNLNVLYNDVFLQTNKVYEDLAKIRAQDAKTPFEKTYLNAKACVSTFLNLEKDAPKAFKFVIIVELLLLNQNFLTLETTAHRSGDWLIKLTSREGIWFLEELVLHSDRAVEILGNLSLQQNVKCDDPGFLQVLHCIHTSNNLYKGLHELHFNFHTIILPESMKKIQNEEPSVIQMISDLDRLIAEIETPIPELIAQLEKILPCILMQMDITPAHDAILAKISDLRASFRSLVHPQIEALTQGQMLLKCFNGLFEKLSQELNNLVSAVASTDVPVSWRKLDQVKEAKSIAAHIFNPKVKAVLDDIFLLKKLQTISEFFAMCVEMSHAFKGTGPVVVYKDEQLVKPIRQFIADFIACQFLGITTETIAYAICFLLQQLGMDVTNEIEQKDIGAESKVPLDELYHKGWTLFLKQGSFTHNVYAQASSLETNLKTAWECFQEPKKLEQNLLLLQSSVLRIQNQLTVHNFVFEDVLRPHPFLQNVCTFTRGKFVTELRNEIGALTTLRCKLSEAREQQKALVASAEQRLKWAAGANPDLNEVLSAFEGAVAARDKRLDAELQISGVVLSACGAILQHELLRIQTPEAKAFDKLFLNACEKWRAVCQYATVSAEVVTSTEENVMKLFTPECLNNPKWLSLITDRISELIISTQKELTEQKNKLFSANDVVFGAIDKLSEKYSKHCKLVNDMKSLIKSMTKIDDYGLQTQKFIADYREYIDKFVPLLHNVKKKVTKENVEDGLVNVKYLEEHTEEMYDNFMNLEVKDDAKNRPQLVRQDGLTAKTAVKQGSMTKGQQRNAYAVSVWRRVKMKLEGQDPDPGRKYTTQEQVDYVIQEATNLDNLALLYEGWTPWV